MTSNWFHSEKLSFSLGGSSVWAKACPSCDRKCLSLSKDRITCHSCGFESRVIK